MAFVHAIKGTEVQVGVSGIEGVPVNYNKEN